MSNLSSHKTIEFRIYRCPKTGWPVVHQFTNNSSRLVEKLVPINEYNLLTLRDDIHRLLIETTQPFARASLTEASEDAA